jgi:hypothetical protein
MPLGAIDGNREMSMKKNRCVMADRIMVDTIVLLYAYDRGQPKHLFKLIPTNGSD